MSMASKRCKDVGLTDSSKGRQVGSSRGDGKLWHMAAARLREVLSCVYKGKTGYSALLLIYFCVGAFGVHSSS